MTDPRTCPQAIEHAKTTFFYIKNLAHNAWLDPRNLEAICRRIENYAITEHDYLDIDAPTVGHDAAPPAQPVATLASVDETLTFIRQCVAGRCNVLDLMEIRDAIDRTIHREERTPSDTPPAPPDSERKTMPDDCGRCGAPRESTIHMTTNTNTEIRMGAHQFEPDDYVAWLCFKRNGTISVCDSDTPNAFRVYRQRPTPTMKFRDEYQSCPKCGTRWLANETLPCPSCSGVAAEGSQPILAAAQVAQKLASVGGIDRWTVILQKWLESYTNRWPQNCTVCGFPLGPGHKVHEFTIPEPTPDYKALCGELLAALVVVLKLMDDEILVRDIRNDADPAWAIKQIPLLVLALKKAQEAIKAAKEAGL